MTNININYKEIDMDEDLEEDNYEEDVKNSWKKMKIFQFWVNLIKH